MEPLVIRNPATGRFERKQEAPAMETQPFSTTVALVSSTAVTLRLRELEALLRTDRSFCITRKNERPGQDPLLARGFSTDTGAEEFIERGDYSRDRFVISAEARMSPDELTELKRLHDLRAAGIAIVGENAWDQGVTLYNGEFLDANWAKRQAIGVLGPIALAIEEWPLNILDWDKAARVLRTDHYSLLYYGSTAFYTYCTYDTAVMEQEIEST